MKTKEAPGQDRLEPTPREATGPPSLLAGEVDLWFAEVGDGESGHLDDLARRYLDGDEMARMEKLRLPASRRLFAASHLLVRQALSHVSARPLADWQFIPGEHGKPLVAPEMGMPDLRFSLSHTAGLAVVAVSRDADVGVDVERWDRPVRAWDLVRRFFSPKEVAELGKLSPEALRNRFFSHWILKEAYIKALGSGLSHPLDAFGFDLAPSPNPPEGADPRDVGFQSDAGLESAAGVQNDVCLSGQHACPSGEHAWRIGFFTDEGPAPGGRVPQFSLFEPCPPYRAALCALPDRPGRVRVICRSVVCLGESLPLACASVALSDGFLHDK